MIYRSRAEDLQGHLPGREDLHGGSEVITWAQSQKRCVRVKDFDAVSLITIIASTQGSFVSHHCCPLFNSLFFLFFFFKKQGHVNQKVKLLYLPQVITERQDSSVV